MFLLTDCTTRDALRPFALSLRNLFSFARYTKYIVCCAVNILLCVQAFDDPDVPREDVKQHLKESIE